MTVATPEILDPPRPPSEVALPARRPDLVVRPVGAGGEHVVKDPRSGEYFAIGPQEHFLLVGLDGERTADALRAAFERRWGEPLAAEDLEQFLRMASEQGFLSPAPDATPPAAVAGSEAVAQVTPAPRARQSLLFWRKSVFDPDRLFTWLAPHIRFVWTRAFLAASAGCVLLALALLWVNRGEFATHFAGASAARWETWLLAWLTLVAATTLHEFAHGLTCKHFGGEVHEVGFLMMFFVPCLYCNVSDAWLFRRKAERLWVTLAGGYCDLLVFAAAVFLWRVTPTASFPNYLAWVLVSVAGARNLFNFNPLLKLDGYYLLSDAMGLPNLRQRAWDRFTAAARWALWGAARPPAEPRGRFLALFGLASWSFSLAFLCLMLWGYLRLFGARWGAPGQAAVAALAAAGTP